MAKEKTFREIWKLIQIPTYALIAWTLVSLLLTSFNVDASISNIISWLVTIGAYFYLSHVGVEEKLDTSFITKSGAISGAISGFIGGIISIVAYAIKPGIFAAPLAKMTEAGLSNAQAVQYMKVGLYASLVTGPLFGAIVGGLITLIIAWAIKKWG